MNTKRIFPIVAGFLLMASLMACNAPGAASPEATQPPEAVDNESLPVQEAPPTEAPTSIPVETASACDNPYMPIVVGATWDYTLTGPVSDTYTHTVLSVESDRFTEQDVFGVGVTRQGTWQCKDGALIALNPPSGGSSTVTTDEVQVDLQTKELSGVTLPATIKAGDTWSQSLTLEGTQTVNGTALPARNQLTSNCIATRIEPVTVAAGTFDAMRVECQTTMNISLQMGETESATTLTLMGISWYVEGVGMVKNATVGMGLDSTTELVSYHIPN